MLALLGRINRCRRAVFRTSGRRTTISFVTKFSKGEGAVKEPEMLPLKSQANNTDDIE